MIMILMIMMKYVKYNMSGSYLSMHEIGGHCLG